MKCCVRDSYTVHLIGHPPYHGGSVIELTEAEYAVRTHQVYVIEEPEREREPIQATEVKPIKKVKKGRET